MKYRKPKHQQFEADTFCYMEQLYKLAFARVGNTQDAEDVLQETYLKAYRGYETIKDKNSVKIWLTRILINTANDHLRKELRIAEALDIRSLPDEVEPKSTQAGPDEIASYSEIDPELLRVLQMLPHNQSAALLLREIQDASYEEIAEIMQVPIGTVMSRLSRARAFMRKHLRPCG